MSLLGFMMVLGCVIALVKSCPDGCICPLSTVINCRPNTVTRIPNIIGGNVTTLNLNQNQFAVPNLQRRNFTFMTELVELRLKGCGIEYLEYNTFIDLSKLKLLDLSLNSFRVIAEGTFTGLQLDYLYLGENFNMALQQNAFQGMTTKVLSLDNCRITSLSTTLFSPMRGVLRILFLQGNSIERFQPGMLELFRELEAIRIYDNPLICDCDSRWLKEFYDAHATKLRDSFTGSQQEPRCGSPISLSGQFFQKLSLADFPCIKPTLSAIVSFTQTKGFLSCSSIGNPLPTVTWFKPNGVIVESPPKVGQVVNKAELDLYASEASVYGQYQCVTRNSAGNLSLTVNITWPFEIKSRQPDLTTLLPLPCKPLDTEKPKEIEINNRQNLETATLEDNVFKAKYFTLIDLICAIFGSFLSTLIICVVILHFCVYKKRMNPPQYITPPMSEYSTNSIKTGGYPTPLQQMHNRPLPPIRPFQKLYDDHHYMSTNVEERDEFLRASHHADPALPSCEACKTATSGRS